MVSAGFPFLLLCLGCCLGEISFTEVSSVLFSLDRMSVPYVHTWLLLRKKEESFHMPKLRLPLLGGDFPVYSAGGFA